MKKIVKLSIGAAASAAALTLGAGAFIYESMLNMKLSKHMIKVLGITDERTAKIYSSNEVFTSSYEWYDAVKPEKIAYADANGEKIYGEVLKNPADTGKWAICIHGFHGFPRSEAPYAKFFYENGCSIIFPHIRAHGLDTHKYCSMGWHEKDMLLAWAQFAAAEDKNARVILHGASMGAAAVLLATGDGSLPECVKAAVADCSFTNCYDEFLYEVAATSPLPVKPVVAAMNAASIISGNFDFRKNSPVDAVRRSKTPTLFIHGSIDDLIPVRMCHELYESCAAPKEKLIVEGALHAVSVAIDNEAYMNAMLSFSDKYL